MLQSEVLAFVNYVAEIVHGFVDEFFGAPNKNLGESFVVVTASFTVASVVFSGVQTVSDGLASDSSLTVLIWGRYSTR